MGMQCSCNKSEGFTFQRACDLPPRTDGVVCLPCHAHRRPGIMKEIPNYLMVLIMLRPISTQQWAWSWRGSGSPETQ